MFGLHYLLLEPVVKVIGHILLQVLRFYGLHLLLTCWHLSHRILDWQLGILFLGYYSYLLLTVTHLVWNALHVLLLSQLRVLYHHLWPHLIHDLHAGVGSYGVPVSTPLLLYLDNGHLVHGLGYHLRV